MLDGNVTWEIIAKFFGALLLLLFLTWIIRRWVERVNQYEEINRLMSEED